MARCVHSSGCLLQGSVVADVTAAGSSVVEAAGVGVHCTRGDGRDVDGATSVMTSTSALTASNDTLDCGHGLVNIVHHQWLGKFMSCS